MAYTRPLRYRPARFEFEGNFEYRYIIDPDNAAIAAIANQVAGEAEFTAFIKEGLDDLGVTPDGLRNGNAQLQKEVLEALDEAGAMDLVTVAVKAIYHPPCYGNGAHPDEPAYVEIEECVVACTEALVEIDEIEMDECGIAEYRKQNADEEAY